MRFLVTGATGMIGQYLCALCKRKGHEVNFLTTSPDKITHDLDYQGFYWNPETGEVDKECLRNVDKIIHLAGANVAKRWTKKHRKAIVDSRVKTAQLLFDLLSEQPNEVTQFISASAIGIYPGSISQLYDEDSKEIDNGFLGEVVMKWEAAADQFKHLGVGVTKIRIGLVLAANGGILNEIKKPIQNGIGAPLGSGKQWQSWIHIDDLTRLFLFVAEEEQAGLFNAVAPHPVKQRNLMRAVAKRLERPLFMPPVPPFLLKLALGDMAIMALSSQLVMSKYLQRIHFRFKYHHVQKAINDLL